MALGTSETLCDKDKLISWGRVAVRRLCLGKQGHQKRIRMRDIHGAGAGSCIVIYINQRAVGARRESPGVVRLETGVCHGLSDGRVRGGAGSDSGS